MKDALTEIFSEYGNIIDLVAKKNLRAKGQAFIVFDDVQAAGNAIEEVQGFELFDKPMVLDYAKTRSDATVEREGGEEQLEAYKRKRLAEKGVMRKMISVWTFTDLVSQSGSKQLRRRSLQRNSNDLLQSPIQRPSGLLNQLKALGSSLHLPQRVLLSQRSIYRPTKFYLSKTYLTNTVWKASPLFSGDLKVLGKSAWYLDAKVLLLLSMRRKPVPSVLKKALPG